MGKGMGGVGRKRNLIGKLLEKIFFFYCQLRNVPKFATATAPTWNRLGSLILPTNQIRSVCFLIPSFAECLPPLRGVNARQLTPPLTVEIRWHIAQSHTSGKDDYGSAAPFIFPSYLTYTGTNHTNVFCPAPSIS